MTLLLLTYKLSSLNALLYCTNENMFDRKLDHMSNARAEIKIPTADPYFHCGHYRLRSKFTRDTFPDPKLPQN